MTAVVLIPAYEPNRALVELVGEIIGATAGHPKVAVVVVVDDGSGPDYAQIFETVRMLGADVIGHADNRGKGYALKQGFTFVETHYPGRDVVCADCDGQHRVADILHVADELGARPQSIVLGSRLFAGDIPTRSRVGNIITRVVFHHLTGLRLQDTQTGLRGCSAAMLPWLRGIRGDHFQFEIEVLLAAKRAGITLHEVPIETVYLEGNRSSHFRPVRDSISIYVPFLKFSMSSLAAFALDATLFFVLIALTGHLAVSIVGARVVSASANFVANRRLVLQQHRQPLRTSAIRYAALAVLLLGTNYALMRFLLGPVSLPLVLAKVLTEAGLFVASYKVQRHLVFDATG